MKLLRKALIALTDMILLFLSGMAEFILICAILLGVVYSVCGGIEWMVSVAFTRELW